MFTGEAFYCPVDDAIVRGKNEVQTPNPDGSITVIATCSLCEGEVHKTIYPDEVVLLAPIGPQGLPPGVTLKQELERIEAAIDAKEAMLVKYIERLYEGDVELAKKLDPSPLDIARLMGDKEYEGLLERRARLAEAEPPVALLKDTR